MLAELYFNLPMFSAVLLLIAGVLLGYALWFPFRGDSESITRRLNELRDQNDDLHGALRKDREAYAKLEQQYAQQCEELTALQVSSTRVESVLSEQNSVRSDLASSVETIKELKSAAKKQLEVERTGRLALEEQLRKAQESVHDSDQLAAQLKTQGEDYRNLQSKYEMLVEQLEATKDTNASLTRQRDHLQETVSENRESLLATEKLLSNTIVTQDTVEEKLITLQSELMEQREKYQALADDRDDLAEQLNLQQEQNLELQSQIQEQCGELAERRDASESSVAMREELSSLQRELDHTRARLERTVAELADAVAACEQAVVERDAVAATVDAVRTDLAHHQRAIETIERHHSKTKSSLSNQAQLQSELEQLVRQHEHTIETIREELVELTMLRQQCITLQTTLQDQETQLNATRLDRDAMAAELAAGKNQWKNFEHRQTSHQLDLDRLRKHREELLGRLNDSEARNHDLANALAEQSERLEQLAPMLTQIDSLADQNASSESHLQEQHAKIGELTAQRDVAEREASQAGEALTQTMNELNEARRSIIALERDRDEVSGRLRRQNVMLESHLAKTEDHEPGTEMAELTRHERRGLVYISAPAQGDDLKKISGVARVLEQRLNEFGIYTYKQIMEWDSVAVEEFSKLLAFRDRIERDDWIGQAAALFQQKHGRAA